MQALQNLAIYVLATQATASIFLIIAYYVDSDTFKKVKTKGHPAIPGLFRIIVILRNTQVPLAMGLSFLALAFVILSYAGVVLLIVQIVRLLVG